jgi:hypothetical protein
MSEKGELLACPFCGGAPAVEVVGVAGQNTLIYCEACHSDSHITCEAWAGVRAEAVSRWNTRTPQPAGEECDECRTDPWCNTHSPLVIESSPASDARAEAHKKCLDCGKARGGKCGACHCRTHEVPA